MSATFLLAVPLLVHLGRPITVQITTATPPAATSTTALLGDSQASGLLGPYLSSLDAANAVTVYAIPGSTVGANQTGQATCHDQVSLMTSEGCFDTTILSIGLNDLLAGIRTPQEVVDELLLAELAVFATCPDSLVLINEISGLMPWTYGAIGLNLDIDAANTIIQQAFGARALMTHDAVYASEFYLADGIHLTGPGLYLWATIIEGALP